MRTTLIALTRISIPRSLNSSLALSRPMCTISQNNKKPERSKRLTPSAEGHTSSLMDHGCCNTQSRQPESSNRVFNAVNASLNSIKLLSWIGDMHYTKFGAAISVAGLLGYHSLDGIGKSISMAVVLCFGGLPMFRSALLQLCRLDVGASTLMSLSALGSIGLGMPGEGLLLLVLFQISHMLESNFTSRSKESLRDLLQSVPDKALVVKVQPGSFEPVIDSAEIKKAADIPIGSFILIKPGEQVPLDGVVVNGSASVTAQHITGESMPIPVHVGSNVAAGSHNEDGLLVLKTLATVEDSTPSKIANLAEEAQKRKPSVHRWIDEVTGVWSKFALLAAVAVALGCTLMGVQFFGPRGALYRSLCIVTAAAPCALILTPLAYVCALANASQRNILIKSASVFDSLHQSNHIALDKTGTLTEGRLVCTNIVNADDVTGEATESVTGSKKKERALCHAVDLSKRTTHPVAYAILDAGRVHLAPGEGNCKVSDFELVPGFGVRGQIESAHENQPVFAHFGSPEFVQREFQHQNSEIKSAVDSVRSRYGNSISILAMRDSAGQFIEWSAFCFRDELQSMTKAAVSSLQKGSWRSGRPNDKFKKNVSIITGDNALAAKSIGERLDVTDVVSDQSPGGKLDYIRGIQASSKTSKVVMVGDGINDAPALAQADVGISISETATDISSSAADVVLLNGQGVANLPYLFRLSDQLRKIVIQNLCIAFSAMAIVCLPSLGGLMPLWLTVLLHEGSTVLTAFNSCRLLFIQPRKLTQV